MRDKQIASAAKFSFHFDEKSFSWTLLIRVPEFNYIEPGSLKASVENLDSMSPAMEVKHVDSYAYAVVFSREAVYLNTLLVYDILKAQETLPGFENNHAIAEVANLAFLEEKKKNAILYNHYVNAPPHLTPKNSPTELKPMLHGSYLKRTLPGLKALVTHPEKKHDPYYPKASVESTIISLNDHHGWTREQIADWLETLDVDLEFK